jgi:hypothetical protein
MSNFKRGQRVEITKGDNKGKRAVFLSVLSDFTNIAWLDLEMDNGKTRRIRESVSRLKEVES